MDEILNVLVEQTAGSWHIVSRTGDEADAYDMTLWLADDRGKQGKGPKPMPTWAGSILARVLLTLGPKGLEFGRYSIDYHFIRNYLHVTRAWGPQRAKQHVPEYAHQLINLYNKDDAVTNRLVPLATVVRLCLCL